MDREDAVAGRCLVQVLSTVITSPGMNAQVIAAALLRTPGG